MTRTARVAGMQQDSASGESGAQGEPRQLTICASGVPLASNVVLCWQLRSCLRTCQRWPVHRSVLPCLLLPKPPERS